MRSHLSWVPRVGLGPRRYWPILIAAVLAEAAHAPFISNSQATPRHPVAADNKPANKAEHPDEKKASADMHGPRRPDDNTDPRKRDKKRKPDEAVPKDPVLFDPTPQAITPSTYTPLPSPPIRLFNPGGDGGGGALPIIDGGGGDDPLVPRNPDPGPHQIFHGSDGGGGAGTGGNSASGGDPPPPTNGSGASIPEPQSLATLILVPTLLARRKNKCRLKRGLGRFLSH